MGRLKPQSDDDGNIVRRYIHFERMVGGDTETHGQATPTQWLSIDGAEASSRIT